MTVDGVLLGVLSVVVGVGVGVVIAEYYRREIEDVKQQLGEVMVQQQTSIDALEQYIADHSDGEASAESLGWDA